MLFVMLVMLRFTFDGCSVNLCAQQNMHTSAGTPLNRQQFESRAVGAHSSAGAALHGDALPAFARICHAVTVESHYASC